MLESRKARIVAITIISSVVCIGMAFAYKVTVPLLCVYGAHHIGRRFGRKIKVYVREGK